MHLRDGVGEIVASQVTALQGLHEASHKLVQEVDLEGKEREGEGGGRKGRREGGREGGEGIERPAHHGTTLPF